jgi:hypothetical protein
MIAYLLGNRNINDALGVDEEVSAPLAVHVLVLEDLEPSASVDLAGLGKVKVARTVVRLGNDIVSRVVVAPTRDKNRQRRQGQRK